MDTSHHHHLDHGPATGRSARKVALTILALGLASAAVVFGSLAAWTAQTTNPGNSVTAGRLAMTNDKNATHVFTATNVRPGDDNGVGENVVIGNTGDTALNVTLTQKMQATLSDLDGQLELQVHDGTNCVYPAGAGACGTWGAWNGATTMNGLAVGTIPAAGSKTFNFKWRFPNTAGDQNASQGDTASFGLTWDGVIA